MKITKRLAVLVLGVLFSLSFASEQDVNPPLGAWEMGVIVIDHRDKEATGFYVDTNLVLTAAHLSQSRVWKFYGCYPYWGWGPARGLMKLTPLMIDTDADLLLLKAEKSAPHIFRNFAEAKENDTVWVVGYQAGYNSAERASVARHVNTNWLALDQRIAPLGSGSPVINRNGDVIGMVIATDEFFTVFVPAGTITAFLERYYRTIERNEKTERNPDDPSARD